MMGYNHVTTGFIAGLLTLPDGSWGYQAGWVAAVGGAALLPDLDSRSASAARVWGPLTAGMSRVVAHIAGGHRAGTHDLLLGPLVFGLVTWAASMSNWSSMVVLALMIAMAIKGLSLTGLGTVSVTVNFVLSVAGAWWLQTSGAVHLNLELALAVALGMAIHIAGDALTPVGVPIPLLWLFGVEARLGVPLFGTGGKAEKTVVAPVLSAVALYLLWHAVDTSDAYEFLASLIDPGS